MTEFVDRASSGLINIRARSISNLVTTFQNEAPLLVEGVNYDVEVPYLLLAQTFEQGLWTIAESQMGPEMAGHIMRNGRTGVHLMAAVLEIIPLKHLEQYPDEDPLASELAGIARRSFPYFLGRIAEQGVDVAVPMVQSYFGAVYNTTKNAYEFPTNPGILNNWDIVLPERLDQFNLLGKKGRRKLTPKHWKNTLNSVIKDIMRRGQFDESGHCPTLDITTEDGKHVLPIIWEAMVKEAQGWHYVHTISRARENLPTTKATKEAAALHQELVAIEGKKALILLLGIDRDTGKFPSHLQIVGDFLQNHSGTEGTFVTSSPTPEDIMLLYKAFKEADSKDNPTPLVIVVQGKLRWMLGDPFLDSVHFAKKIEEISNANGWKMPFLIGSNLYGGASYNGELAETYPEHYLGDDEYYYDVLEAIQKKLSLMDGKSSEG